MKGISRRDFIKACILSVCFAALDKLGPLLPRAAADTSAFNGRPKKNILIDYDLVSVKGDDPYAMTVKGVESLGGMERFVRSGATVVIKPNIGWDRSPAQAGNTNPDVIGALIDLSFQAGAKRVNVFDIPCNDPRRCYANSGIEKTAKEKGASVYFADDWNVVKARFGYPSLMEGWPILKDAIDCDTFINVPVLKHHGLTTLTIAMKNLMGVCAGNRGLIHRDIGPKLVDLNEFINPDLTVVDAYRSLARNGPTGGNLADVVDTRIIMAGVDATLLDTYAARLVGVDPMDVPSIASAIGRGIGNPDIAKARILETRA